MKMFCMILKDGHLTEVEFMTATGGYAMVRNPGCVPFIVSLREIQGAVLMRASAKK